MRASMRRSLRWMIPVSLIAISGVLLAGCRGAEEGRDGVTQDGSGRQVVAWIDPMYAQGPPHLYKVKHPGTAPDCGMTLIPLYADRSQAPSAGTPPNRVPGYADVTISPERQQLIGVRLATAEKRDLSRKTRSTARIAIDERRVTQVHSRIDGFISTLYVNVTGQLVRRGDPLLTLFSPELLATQQELVLAGKDKSELGRTLAQAARARLGLWDMQAEDIDKVVKSGEPVHDVVVRSPVSGTVMVKNLVAGAHITPQDTLFEIADLTQVWALADIYESELPYVHVGSSAEVAVAGKTFRGRVTFVGPVVEIPTRTAKVRIEIDNSRGVFKPDMYADVVLQERIGNVVSVPDGAVMQTGTRAVVLVAHGQGRFEPRQIETGVKAGGFYEVRSGLQPGESVVAQANFLIDSESQLKAALSRF